ncbi:uncharacterized protein [Lepidochelys kempii]|uniref:uncharacterized protein n=1 Tax=Lepidochelys kempii TaxID=8472 RepID=UPI003C6EEB06
MEEKIQGLEMLVETLLEFRRGFERIMEQRHEEAEGKSSDLQMEAGSKNSERRLLGEESGQWKHMTKRTRQRKRRASEGEIELRNKSAEFENEEGAQQVVTEGERARKKRRAANSIERGEESMEITTPNMSPRELKVCQFTAQGGDDAEWPEGVYYEGKRDGSVEEVNLSMTLGRMWQQQIKELCTNYAPTFSDSPGLTEWVYHSIDTVRVEVTAVDLIERIIEIIYVEIPKVSLEVELEVKSPFLSSLILWRFIDSGSDEFSILGIVLLTEVVSIGRFLSSCLRSADLETFLASFFPFSEGGTADAAGVEGALRMDRGHYVSVYLSDLKDLELKMVWTYPVDLMSSQIPLS